MPLVYVCTMEGKEWLQQFFEIFVNSVFVFYILTKKKEEFFKCTTNGKDFKDGKD